MFKEKTKPSLRCLWRVVTLLTCACLLGAEYPAVTGAELAGSAEAAIVIECNQNKPIYEKNADKRLPMASTTKIMTALTALEYFDPDTKMTVPESAVGIEGTSACLEAGEVYSLEELLYALLLQSANDAAVAIAVNVCGSTDSFATLMTAKAKQLGLCNTCFQNPHGLPSPEHYTTARELALLSSHALKNECIAKITATKSAKIVSECGKTRYFTNHNRMLSLYEGSNGVKTGYTKASGRCLVSGAYRDGLQLIAVTLNCPNDWREHKAMLDFGFSSYESVSLSELAGLSRFIPAAGTSGRMLHACAEDIKISVKKGERDCLRVVYEHPTVLFSSVRVGAPIGRIVCFNGTEPIAAASLVATHNVEIS